MMPSPSSSFSLEEDGTAAAEEKFESFVADAVESVVALEAADVNELNEAAEEHLEIVADSTAEVAAEIVWVSKRELCSSLGDPE